MLVRLTTLRRNPESLRPQGLFAPAYALRREGRCPAGLEDWLGDTLDWFDEHLNAPWVADPRAIFWLWSRRRSHVRRMWALAAILREADENVQIVTTRRPGYVVYRDRHQVAAVPFRDTFDVRSGSLTGVSAE